MPARIVVDSLTAPINGLYGIEDEDGNVIHYNFGTLYGAIDVALFVMIIGGVPRDHDEDRRDRRRHRRDRASAWEPRAPAGLALMAVFAARRHLVRHGRGEPWRSTF